MRMMVVAVSLAAFTVSAGADDAAESIAPGAILAAAKTSPGSTGATNRAGEAKPAWARPGYSGYRSYRGYGYGYGYGYGGHRGYRPYSASPSNTRSDLDNVEPGSIMIRSEAASGPPRLLQPQ